MPQVDSETAKTNAQEKFVIIYTSRAVLKLLYHFAIFFRIIPME